MKTMMLLMAVGLTAVACQRGPDAMTADTGGPRREVVDGDPMGTPGMPNASPDARRAEAPAATPRSGDGGDYGATMPAGGAGGPAGFGVPGTGADGGTRATNGSGNGNGSATGGMGGGGVTGSTDGGRDPARPTGSPGTGAQGTRGAERPSSVP